MVHEGIYTYWDCPNRKERIKTREDVFQGFDWKQGLCPNTCPMSPRNSDYSECEHPSQDMDCPVEVQSCRLGGTSFSGTGVLGTTFFWCEGIVAMKKCPRGYVR